MSRIPAWFWLHRKVAILALAAVGSSFPADSLNSTGSVRVGQTLVSAGNVFVLGFFSPGSSRHWFLGSWYAVDPGSVLWVANREQPLRDSGGSLAFGDPLGTGKADLVIVNGSGSIVWSANVTGVLRSPVAQLLDSGNLVVRESDEDTSDGGFSWQSFDYPSNTLLPGMKLGWDSGNGPQRVITSWKSQDDPSPGIYVHGFVHQTIIQLDVNGLVERLTRENGSSSWGARFTNMDDPCNGYGQCGPNGFCRANKDPRCECLKGYAPKYLEQWQRLNLSGGCVREVQSNCSVDRDGFFEVPNAKLPDLIDFWLDKNMNLQECRRQCLENCSCTAYTNPDVRNGGSGCLMWFGDLIDVAEFRDDEYRQILYLRLPKSELDSFKGSAVKKRKVVLAAILSFTGLIVLGGAFLAVKNAKHRKGGSKFQGDDTDLTLLDFATVVNATRNFSETNLIGKGGFGSVYKGYLVGGREVAVKRLSKSSGQGIEEFMNEALLIARLQHRNLVGLLGCCIEGEERILIYEYMPNKSLDYFIFDKSTSDLLTWEKRFDIIVGIARGLLYLHQDSKLQVIHRDIKTSNILLDADMNPKISDFGLARIVAGSDKESRTRRIIGTYGYMSPEYAFNGRFSEKSDVFSFGVLLLEVVSGQRNREFDHQDNYHHLLGHAWLLWREGRELELIHKPPGESTFRSQMKRSIHVGLLCVQKNSEDRPSMSSVVFMLANEGLNCRSLSSPVSSLKEA
ncbi:hypothetical protein MLD38_040287 [Melastoma candidum]|uniref:Uncharacterized protein n=1 Tax=Melastoma candidum TaxID=119954 RepID=A0ACB9L5Y7_9MYRT|nr:hypothetical protein MLD38_040287 [Melastoma candidum]